jgi:hypothetical protein
MPVSLKKNPTFKLPVKIYQPGADPEVVNFEFKHKGRKEFGEYCENRGASDIDAVMAIVCGWDVVDKFDVPNPAIAMLANLPDDPDRPKPELPATVKEERPVPFNAENLAIFLDERHTAAFDIVREYITKLSGVVQGN